MDRKEVAERLNKKYIDSEYGIEVVGGVSRVDSKGFIIDLGPKVYDYKIIFSKENKVMESVLNLRKNCLYIEKIRRISKDKLGKYLFIFADLGLKIIEEIAIGHNKEYISTDIVPGLKGLCEKIGMKQVEMSKLSKLDYCFFKSMFKFSYGLQGRNCLQMYKQVSGTVNALRDTKESGF